jgi:hypothetical protein
MKLVLYFLLFLVFIFLLIIFYKLKSRNNIKLKQDSFDREEIISWKKERRKNKFPITLDVQSIGNNLENSHKLWKSLVRIVHESNWTDKSESKRSLASELNKLINENKGNYDKLQKIKIIIDKELLQIKD